MSEESEVQRSQQEASPIQTILPLEIIDKSIGSKIHVLLTNEKEYKGTLIGFDDYVNMVLENVEEIDNEGKNAKIIKKMLLNGSHVAMIVPSLQ